MYPFPSGRSQNGRLDLRRDAAWILLEAHRRGEQKLLALINFGCRCGKRWAASARTCHWPKRLQQFGRRSKIAGNLRTALERTFR